jgi:hypothetical protein
VSRDQAEGGSSEPGVLVLGMHRSGTSVLAGVMDALGFDGGPATSMRPADRFNCDGYREQLPIIELHERVLRELHGWASAPPPVPSRRDVGKVVDLYAAGISQRVTQLYRGPWFMKDPRQCLLLPLWQEVRDETDIRIAVFRKPDAVVASLTRRNGYPTALSVALWERYCNELLRGLEGAPAIVVPYEALIENSRLWVGMIADALGDAFGDRAPDLQKNVDSAARFVRASQCVEAGDGVVLNREQQRLVELIQGIDAHANYVVKESDVPPLSEEGTAVIERRRRRLNLIPRWIRPSSMLRGKLDRIQRLTRASHR